MRIKYAGPKPLISHRGIDFDHSKEDKYIYLHVALQILKAIDHEYYEDRQYTYKTHAEHVSEDELEMEIKRVCEEYEQLVDKQDHKIEDEVHAELVHARENDTLDELEKETLENNIKMMHDYLIQRSINKRVYYCVIGKLAEVVKKDNLDYIVAPMQPVIVHVLHSIEGVLAKDEFPIDTNIEVYEENSELFVKLDLINR
ncbi:MAG: hypothetical protein ABXS93_08220 [Sulfurimonas sp.]